SLCKMLRGTMAGDHCNLTASPEEAPLRLIIITESLGSRITFDTIGKMRQEEPDDEKRATSIDELAKRTGEIYMLANQLPLLELASVDVPQGMEEAGVPATGLSAFLRARRSGPESGGTPRLTVVA